MRFLQNWYAWTARTRARFLRTAHLGLVAVLAALLSGALPAAQAMSNASTPVEVGYRSFSYGTTGNSTPTGEKPESKLWWNDGSWWGSLYNDATQAYHIYRFDPASQSFTDTGTQLDDRNSSKADVLWTGQKLYVVSHVFTTDGQATSSNWGRLFRYSYDGGSDAYSLDGGFPVDVTRGKSETLTIDRDSTGQLWVTYVEAGRVMVNHSLDSDLNWGVPFALPVGDAANVSSDDISVVVAFQGDKIGVMWSNQTTDKVYFGIHLDADGDTMWQAASTALPGPGCSGPCADDHLNIKSLGTDAAGRVFAAIKTSHSSANAPLNMLLVRQTNGEFTTAVFGTVGEGHTRPIVLLDQEHSLAYMIATAPESGGTIYYKTTDLNNPSFSRGLGTPLIQSSLDSRTNNVTSTKQNLDSTTGLLVMASDNQTRFYLHNFLPLGGGGGPAAPVISSFTPASGAVGSQVTLTGSNLTSASSVTFNGTAAATFTVDSATQIRANVPAGATNGPIGVVTPGGSALSAQAFTVTAEPGGLVFNPTDDSQVKSTSPNKNFGTLTTIKLKAGGPVFNSYLKFNVSGVNGTVQQAILRLYVTDRSPTGGRVHSVSNDYLGTSTPWLETGLTWNNAPAISGTPLGTAGEAALNTWVEFDVTAAVTGNGTYSFGLDTTSSNSLFYASRESSTNRPELVLVTGN